MIKSKSERNGKGILIIPGFAGAVLMAFLVAGMLMFGCTYSGQYSANYSLGNNSNSTMQNPAGEGTTQPSGNEPATEGTAPETTPEPVQTSPPSETDLSNKQYSDLILLGTPSQCALSYTVESGGTVNLNLFFDGNGAMRMEQHDTGIADCSYALMIFKGDSSGNGVLYLNCPDNNAALGRDIIADKNCDWQSMNISIEYGGIGSSSLGLSDGYSTPPINYVQEPHYECQSWVMDSFKFDTPGFVCT